MTAERDALLAQVRRLSEIPPRASMERVNHITESELGYPDGTEIYHIRFRAFRTGFVRGQDYMQARAHDLLSGRLSSTNHDAQDAGEE